MKLLFIAFWVSLKAGLFEAGYLTGKHLRMGFIESPPDIYSEWNTLENRTVYRGHLILLLQWMAKRDKFSFTLTTIDYTKRFNGLPEQFEEKKLDVAFNTFVVAHPRSLLAHYLVPVALIKHTLVIPYPKSKPNIWSIFKPYTATVWLCFLGSAVIMVFLLGYAARLKRSMFGVVQRQDILTLAGAYTYVIGVTTNQGATCFSKARTVRLLAGVWCLAAVVLVNGYSGSLITYLMAPIITPLVSSLKDIQNKSEPQILTLVTSYIQLLFETDPDYSSFRDNYLQHPNNFCGQLGDKELDGCITKIEEGTHVLAVESTVAHIITNQEFHRLRSCELSTIEDEFEKFWVAVVVPLNSTRQLRNSLDVLIMEAASYGLVDKWYHEYHPKDNFCASYTKHKEQTIRKLALQDLTSAFLILAMGYSFGFLALVYEHFRNF